MSEYFYSVIDIGNTYTKLLTVTVNNDKFYITNTFKTKTFGIKEDGSINEQEFLACISLLIEKANDNENKIEQVIISLPTNKLKVFNSKEEIKINGIVTNEDIKELIKNITRNKIDDKTICVGFNPIEYIRDDKINSKEKPIGLEANKLAINATLITLPYDLSRGIVDLISSLNIKVLFAYIPLVSNASLLLKPSEYKNGAIIIDIGGSGVGISNYIDNNVVEYYKTERGLNFIIDELMNKFNIDYEAAKSILEKYANGDINSVSEYVVFVKNHVEYTEREIVNFIDNCLNLILKETKNKIELFMTNHTNIPYILTGGGANIYKIEEKFSNYLNENCIVRGLNKIGARDYSFNSAIGALTNYLVNKEIIKLEI